MRLPDAFLSQNFNLVEVNGDRMGVNGNKLKIDEIVCKHGEISITIITEFLVDKKKHLFLLVYFNFDSFSFP